MGVEGYFGLFAFPVESPVDLRLKVWVIHTLAHNGTAHPDISKFNLELAGYRFLTVNPAATSLPRETLRSGGKLVIINAQLGHLFRHCLGNVTI